MPEKIPFVVFNIYAEEALIRRYCRLIGIKAEFYTVTAKEALDAEENRRTEMEKRGIKPIIKGRANTGASLFQNAPKGLKDVDLSKVPGQLVKRGYGLIGIYPRRHCVFDAANRIRVGTYKPLLRFVMGCVHDEKRMDPIYLESFIELLKIGAARHVHGRENDYDDSFLLLGGFDSHCNKWQELTVRDDGKWIVQKMGRISEQRSA